MKKTSTNPTTKKGNPTAKAQTGDSSKLPTKPPNVEAATTPVPDTSTARRPDSVPEISTEMPIPATQSTHDPDEEAVMEEFIQKFGSEEKAIEFFARISAKREKKEPAQAPLNTPPQPPIPKDTTITQAPTFPTKGPQPSTDVPASNKPHAEESAVPSKKTEESEAMEGRDREEGDALVEDIQRMDVGEKGESEERVESKGEDTADTGKGSELDVGVGVGGAENLEGETPKENVEGEIPNESLEGETPVVRTIEGKPLLVWLRGKLLVKVWRGKPLSEVRGGRPLLVKLMRGRPLLNRRKLSLLRTWKRSRMMMAEKKDP